MDLADDAPGPDGAVPLPLPPPELGESAATGSLQVDTSATVVNMPETQPSSWCVRSSSAYILPSDTLRIPVPVTSCRFLTLNFNVKAGRLLTACVDFDVMCELASYSPLDA